MRNFSSLLNELRLLALIDTFEKPEKLEPLEKPEQHPPWESYQLTPISQSLVTSHQSLATSHRSVIDILFQVGYNER